MEFVLVFKYTDKNTKNVNLAATKKKGNYVFNNSTDVI